MWTGARPSAQLGFVLGLICYGLAHREICSQLGFKVTVAAHMAQLSFLSCCAEWEKHRVLRKRARSRSMLVIDCKNRNYISPTLTNMKLNHVVLKPFTEAMAKFGRISKPIALIKEAVREFYDSESQPVEEKPETMDMKLRKEKNIVRTAEAIKAMLTMIKRKWCDSITSSVGADDSGDSMGDDSSLRESLQGALSSRSANSPLETFLKAPPQRELEKLLGFSLDPATYKRILRQPDGEKGKHPEPPMEREALAPAEDPNSDAQATLDMLNLIDAEDPVESAAPVEPAPIEPAGPAEPTAVAAPVAEMQTRTPEKPPAPIGPPLSPGSPVEIVHFKPAPPVGDTPTPSTGLAAQLSSMDPNKLRQLLAIVNQLQASGKKVFEPKEDDVARRKLNFDTSDGEGSVASTSVDSTSKGSAPDCVETQLWDVQPEDYLNAWLDSARAEHARRGEESIESKKTEDREREALKTRRQAAKAAEREASETAEKEASKAAEKEASKAAEKEALESSMAVARITKRAAALVVTRQDQLGLTARKKDKPAKPATKNDPADKEAKEIRDRVEAPKRGPGRPKSKAKPAASGSKDTVPKSKAKAKGKSGGCDSEAEKKGGKPKPGSFKRKLSKRCLLSKHKKSKKGSSKVDPVDNATVYYGEGTLRGDGFIAGAVDRERPLLERTPEWTSEEWAAWQAEQAKAAPRLVRQKRKRTTDAEPKPKPDEELDTKEPHEDAEQEDAIIFARRYCPARPWYKAKFLGIKEAYDSRIRAFVKAPGKMEDIFWKYVAQATKEQQVEDEQDWFGVASKLTWPFLLDDSVSKNWTEQGEKLFGGGKKPTRKQYDAAIKKCRAD
ncbi:unnamed protein product [Symbiodinium necroappetens]|uniref:Uncharacterized protein n=1 Tax=Symbiodinium necroappetens TaxID=1628268 RepID=A0A812PDU0_9DINO|nr:unnamed protein product [Symbiodinium necroappetens]